MRAALSTLGLAPRSAYKRRVAVLGDMLELGDQGGRLHRELAEAVDAAGVDVVFACGELMNSLFEALPASRRRCGQARRPATTGPPPAAPPPPPAPDGAVAAGGPAEPAPSGGGLGLVEVRRLWPDLLDAVKLKRRYTWILLSQNAQVAAVDDKTLTIALVNAGARSSFVSGGSEEILRQAAIDVIGRDWRIDAIVDPSAQPGAEPDNEPRVVRPAVTQQQPEPAPPPAAGQPGPAASGQDAPAAQQPPRAAVDPTAIANARGAIQATRAPGARGRTRRR